jgi:hypothetical protein
MSSRQEFSKRSLAETGLGYGGIKHLHSGQPPYVRLNTNHQFLAAAMTTGARPPIFFCKNVSSLA